ncbi:MAG: DeoR/GlpR family DNA-binding transcription regulator [Clostridia bacterium]
MNERRLQIKQMIETTGEVSLQSLKAVFPGLSEMTLRRDLSELESSGHVIRTHGGAISTKRLGIPDGEEFEYSKRAGENIQSKMLIASKALTFIEKRRTIYLDAGSTIMCLVNLIEGQDCTFITSGINNALRLCTTANSVMQLGGVVNRNTLSCSGPDAVAMLENLNIDIAVMSASGFSPERGFTVSNRYESQLKQVVVRKAKKVIMLMDADKINKDLTFSFAGLEDIDVWVYDEVPDENIRTLMEKYQVEWI